MSPEKFFVVRRDDLNSYGSDEGDTEEEVIDMLKAYGPGDDLAIIRGVIVFARVTGFDEAE